MLAEEILIPKHTSVVQGNGSKHLMFFFLFLRFISLDFFTVLDLCWFPRAFSSCSEWRLLFVVVRGLLIAMASLSVKHRL